MNFCGKTMSLALLLVGNIVSGMNSMPSAHNHHSMSSSSSFSLNKTSNATEHSPHYIAASNDDGSSTKTAMKKPVWKDLPFSVQLEPEQRLTYEWDWSETTNTAIIQVRAKVNRQAWLALGFSNDGRFVDADFCVFYVGNSAARTLGGGGHQTTHCSLVDGWTDADGVLHVDAQQDCRLIDAYFDSRAQLVLRYERALDTCDDPFDYVIEDGTTHVVYALGIGPISSIEGLALGDTSRVYSRFERITFTKPHLAPVAYPPNTKIVDITAAQVHVPTSEETTYWCIVQKVPNLSVKNQIIRYEAVITPGSEDLVHHIEVFHCEVPAKAKITPYQGLCHAPNRPKELDRCTRVIGAWAMGAPPLEYPPNAGYPIGGDDYSAYVLIEIHYNNPQHKSGIVDSSGIRFYVTSTPRPFDIGVMELGLEYSPKMAIPPRSTSTVLSGHCISECTQAGLPPTGIVVFASQLHTHLTGVRVQTRHIRNGMELPMLNGDRHFNSMFQEIRRLRRPVRILPGDELLTSCEYVTSDRKNVTLGGFGISDEMCVNYIHYYPRTDLEVCKSSVDSRALTDYFDFLRTQNDDTDVDVSGGKSVEENYHAIHYTPLVAHLQAQFYAQAPLTMQCNKSDGTRFAGSWNRQHQIRIDRPLPPAVRSCPPPTAARASASSYSAAADNSQEEKLSLPQLIFIQDDQPKQPPQRPQLNPRKTLFDVKDVGDGDDGADSAVYFDWRSLLESNNNNEAFSQQQQQQPPFATKFKRFFGKSSVLNDDDDGEEEAAANQQKIFLQNLVDEAFEQRAFENELLLSSRN